VAAYVWSAVLAEFAAAVGARPSKCIILVIDQAGWISSDEVEVPDGLHLVAALLTGMTAGRTALVVE
jgi:hypothetical protein